MEMNKEETAQLLQVFYRAVRVPLTVAEKSGKTLFCLPEVEHDFWPEPLVRKVFDTLLAPGRPLCAPAMLTDSFDIHVGSMLLSEALVLIIGPVSSDKLDLERVAAGHSHESTPDYDQAYINAYRTSIPADIIRFANIMALAARLFHGARLSPAELIRENYPAEIAEPAVSAPLGAPPKVNGSDVGELTLFERMLLEAVMNGNRADLDRALDTLQPLFMHISVHRKELEGYTTLPLYALTRHAAVLGGADQLRVYRLYDLYVQRLPSLRSSSEHVSALISFTRALCGIVSEARYSGAHTEHRKAIEHYISRHIGERITIKDLAAVCGISERQITRVFDEGFGMTMPEYVNRERVSRACVMLTSANYTISEIASRLGFASQSHLGIAFKKYMGMTPGEYRKRPND